MATEATTSDGATNGERRVGLLYDDRMCKHQPPYGQLNIESCHRVRVIWGKLKNTGVSERCVILNAKAAEDKNLLLVHGQEHVDFIKNISLVDSELRCRIADRLKCIYLNEFSSESAYLAAGSVMEAAERVAAGDLHSAFAIVRPPGHHAEPDEAIGACLFNNVAIAAKYILDGKPELNINKILIVDWDAHHGNGTQKIFWKDPRVLFFSVHRRGFGNFNPANLDGDYTMIGEEAGAGYTINVPWEIAMCGDEDYLAVWDHILIPVAKEFSPDMILISAGFDSAKGDPLGRCSITPSGYSVLLRKLMDFGNGKVVLALEGGYNFIATPNSVVACVKTLLGDEPASSISTKYPFEATWRVIKAVREELKTFWPVLADELPEEVTSRKACYSLVQIILSSSESSSSEDDELEPDTSSEETDDPLKSLMKPILSLNLEEYNDEGASSSSRSSSSGWRSDLSKVDIWYATFGSNIWKPRFMCYIEGGQVDGMQTAYTGSIDKTPPKEILWRTFPHRLFFGREYTQTWGPGGDAFFHPQPSEDTTYSCLYKITAEQFNDVILQKNVSSMDLPLFNLEDLSSVVETGSVAMDVVKSGWYSNVVYLGKEQDIPILTLTCQLSDAEGFRCGKFPLRPPSSDYAMAMVRGLVEGGQFTEEDEAMAYISEAASKPLWWGEEK